MNRNSRESGTSQNPDLREQGIMAPVVRPLEIIVSGMIMLKTLQNQYAAGETQGPEFLFREGQIRALSEFIDPETHLLKRFAEMSMLHARYLALEFANRRKAFAQDPEKQGMLTAYRWVLKRKGAKLTPMPFSKDTEKDQKLNI